MEIKTTIKHPNGTETTFKNSNVISWKTSEIDDRRKQIKFYDENKNIKSTYYFKGVDKMEQEAI